jgi:1-acyl-sn-glycerol-3-phosphate acyltransferase
VYPDLGHKLQSGSVSAPWLRPILAGLWLLPLTLYYGTLIIVSSLLAPDGRWLMPLGRRWCRSLLRVGAVKIEVEGLENVRAQPVAIFMANHQSLLDIAALGSVMPDNARFIAKRSLQWIPFFGWALLASRGCVFIDRGNRPKAIQTLEKAALRMKRGASIIVFPEGTRTEPGKLGEFKKGPFHLALASGMPVVPVAISGTGELMPKSSLRIHSGQARIRFGSPIAVGADILPGELSSAVRASIVRLLGLP